MKKKPKDAEQVPPPFEVGQTLDPSAYNRKGTSFIAVGVPCVVIAIFPSSRFSSGFGVTVKMVTGDLWSLDSLYFKAIPC